MRAGKRTGSAAQLALERIEGSANRSQGWRHVGAGATQVRQGPAHKGVKKSKWKVVQLDCRILLLPQQVALRVTTDLRSEKQTVDLEYELNIQVTW